MINFYEAILLFKNIPKEQLVTSIRRTSGSIFNRNGFFRDLKYLGLQTLPYRLSKDGVSRSEAHYLYYEFNVPKKLMSEIAREWKLDRDLIKYTLFPRDSEKEYPIDFDRCTFEDEMKPVPYRSEVVDLVRKARNYARARSNKAKLHIHTPFFPFQR